MKSSTPPEQEQQGFNPKPLIGRPYPSVLAYGFRPFFLLAGIYAVLALPPWIALLQGYPLIEIPAPASAWHAHEMIYGFVIAAMAGFLLTAVPSWTGQRGFAGWPLLALSLLWIAGRIVVVASLELPLAVIASIDLAFLPVLALFILPSLIRSGNRRNLVFLVLLAALFTGNLQFYRNDPVTHESLLFAVNIILLMVALVGGRILPAFTSSGLKNRGVEVRIPRHALLDMSSLAAVIAIVLVDIFNPASIVAGWVAIAAAILLSLRLARWQGYRTLGIPILWILHVAYAWLPVGLALKAAWLFGLPVPPDSWLHALTTGAFATMILAVMSRAALGHTGRALVVSGGMVAGYVLLTLAALLRVFGPIFIPGTWLQWMTLSAVLWCLAFLLFVIVYAPVLCGPRVDGRPG